MALPQRNQAPYIKEKNIPVIICSNFNIDGVYSKAPPVIVEALKARFIQVWIEPNQRLDLKLIQESDDDTAPLYSSDEDLMFQPEDILNMPEMYY